MVSENNSFVLQLLCCASGRDKGGSFVSLSFQTHHLSKNLTNPCELVEDFLSNEDIGIILGSYCKECTSHILVDSKSHHASSLQQWPRRPPMSIEDRGSGGTKFQTKSSILITMFPHCPSQEVLCMKCCQKYLYDMKILKTSIGFIFSSNAG